MKSLKFALAPLALALVLPGAAMAHDNQPAIAASSALLTVSADGRSNRVRCGPMSRSGAGAPLSISTTTVGKTFCWSLIRIHCFFEMMEPAIFATSRVNMDCRVWMPIGSAARLATSMATVGWIACSPAFTD